jgi:hypothetical protein
VGATGTGGTGATIPVTYASFKVQNTAATGASLVITAAGAADGQQLLVRFFDYSATVQGITWGSNTENGAATPPAVSNGATGSPISAGFIFNGVTSKWRCMAAG